MADASSGGDSAEAGVGDYSDMLTEGEMLQCSSNLINLHHACAHRSHADQNDDVTFVHAAVFDGANAIFLMHLDFGWAAFAINTVGIDHRRINCRAFDNGSVGRKIAHRKADG
jgi:hypothetical protein